MTCLTKMMQKEPILHWDELGLIEGQKFSLHYDFGDDWMFAIRVMKIEEVKRHRKPMLLGSKGSVEQYPEGEE